MLYDILNDQQRKKFEEFHELDFSIELKGIARFRVNAFRQTRGEAVVFRVIPSKILTLEELGLPKSLREICKKERGLVLVTGPTGSGKSTTLAAMIDVINNSLKGHIITIEDPIEFVHESKKCLINQRELGAHTLSFCQRPAQRPPRRPGHHPRRGNARPGHHLPGADRRRDRAPGLFHPAHQRGPEDRGPGHRRLSRRAAGTDPRPVCGIHSGHHFPGPPEAKGRPGARCPPWKS